MPRVLIAGCGYVGIAAAKLFRAEGWDVTAWTRSGDIADPDLAGVVPHCAVDLRDREDVRRNRFDCDVVVHCASSAGGNVDEYRRIYRNGIGNLVASFPQARLLFTSSTSVYGQRDGSWVNEDLVAEPSSPGSRLLREAEEIALASGGIVLRLASIYGPGRSFFLQSVMDGTARISSAERFGNQVHRDDVAAAIFFTAGQSNIRPPRIFNVVDNTPAPRREILTWLSLQVGKPLLASAEAAKSKRGDSNKRVSNAKLRALGWTPRYPSYREAFLESILPAKAPL